MSVLERKNFLLGQGLAMDTMKNYATATKANVNGQVGGTKTIQVENVIVKVHLRDV